MPKYNISIRTPHRKLAKGSDGPPVVEITLPSDAGKSTEVVALHVSDLWLTWIDYYKKHNRFLYNYVMQPRGSHQDLVLVDNRIPTKRKSWTMNSSVKAFVNSFLNNRKKYLATLKLESNQNSNENHSSSTASHPTPASHTTFPPRSSSGKQQSAGPTGSSTVLNLTASRKRAAPTPETSATSPKTCNMGENEVNLNLRAQSGYSGEVVNEEETLREMMPPPPIPPRLNGNTGGGGRRIIIPQDDDTASMASTCDSLETLHEMTAAGIHIPEIKRDVVTKLIQQIKNSDMLKIQNELHKVYKDNQWMNLGTKIPISAHFLLVLFNPQNPQK